MRAAGTREGNQSYGSAEQNAAAGFRIFGLTERQFPLASVPARAANTATRPGRRLTAMNVELPCSYALLEQLSVVVTGEPAFAG